jgi:hypothetical protein
VVELVVVDLGAGEVGLLAGGASSVWVSGSQITPQAPRPPPSGGG